MCKKANIDMKGLPFDGSAQWGNQRSRTHDAIAVTWMALFRQAGFLCRMEDPTCFREVQDTNKRAGVLGGELAGPCTGHLRCVSVTHPWIQSMTRHAGGGDPKPECAAKRREMEKLRKHQGVWCLPTVCSWL